MHFKFAPKLFNTLLNHHSGSVVRHIFDNQEEKNKQTNKNLNYSITLHSTYHIFISIMQMLDVRIVDIEAYTHTL